MNSEPQEENARWTKSNVKLEGFFWLLVLRLQISTNWIPLASAYQPNLKLKNIYWWTLNYGSETDRWKVKPTKPSKRTSVRLPFTWKWFLLMLFQQVGLGGYLCTFHFYTSFRVKKSTISKFSWSFSAVSFSLFEVRSLNSFSSGWNLAAFPSICFTSGEFLSSHLCMDSIRSCLWLWLSVGGHVWLLPWKYGKEMLHAASFTYDIVYAICSTDTEVHFIWNNYSLRDEKGSLRMMWWFHIVAALH